MTLNGKKKKIKRKEFIQAMDLFKLEPKVISNIFAKFSKSIVKWPALIDQSFLPDNTKERYHEMIFERVKRLDLSLHIE